MPLHKPLPTRFFGARLAPSVTLTQSGFLFSASDGETYSLNESGVCLFSALRRGVAPMDLGKVLSERFSLALPVAERDAQLFLARLFNLGLLELPPDAMPEDRERPQK